MARGKATRFTTLIIESTDSTSLDDYEYYRDRLQETLDQLVSLADDIQDLLETVNTQLMCRSLKNTSTQPSEQFLMPRGKSRSSSSELVVSGRVLD
jgi:hypothetical protein